MEHKAFLTNWCRTFTHTKEKDVFILHALRFSLAPNPREGSFHVMCVRNHNIDEQNELTTCKLESRYATKITSALARLR